MWEKLFYPKEERQNQSTKSFKINYLRFFTYFLWIRNKDANLKLAPNASDETHLSSLIWIILFVEKKKNHEIFAFSPHLPSWRQETGHPFSDCTFCTNSFSPFWTRTWKPFWPGWKHGQHVIHKTCLHPKWLSAMLYPKEINETDFLSVCCSACLCSMLKSWRASGQN